MKGVLVWQAPKIAHQRLFILPLLTTPIPLVIVCMRAKYPMVQDKGRTEWRRSETLEPKQSEDILFEMFAHGWIDRDHNLHVTKYTRDDLRKILVDGKPITQQTGERLAAWANDKPISASHASPLAETAAPAIPAPSTPAAGAVSSSDEIAKYDKLLSDAADKGVKALKREWDRIPVETQKILQEAVKRRHKPRAEEVDGG
jgi:hypothetical protein